MAISIDEYFEAEGIVPVTFKDVEEICTARFGQVYKDEHEEIVSSLNRPDKDVVLNLYSHAVKFNKLGFLVGLNHEQNKQNMPLILLLTLPYERIADLGCSDCFKTVFYALNYPDKKFTAVDMHSESLELAEKRIKKYGVKNIDLVCKDLYDFGELYCSFDQILAINMLHECRTAGVSSYGFEMDMDFFNKIDAINPSLESSGRLVVSLNYFDKENEEGIFNWELEHAALENGLSLILRKCRFFNKGGYEEYNGLYIFSK